MAALDLHSQPDQLMQEPSQDIEETKSTNKKAKKGKGKKVGAEVKEGPAMRTRGRLAAFLA